MARVDGEIVNIGDWVSFKCDIEQSGKIYRIEGDRLFLEAGPNGFEGGYIGCLLYTSPSPRDRG